MVVTFFMTHLGICNSIKWFLQAWNTTYNNMLCIYYLRLQLEMWYCSRRIHRRSGRWNGSAGRKTLKALESKTKGYQEFCSPIGSIFWQFLDLYSVELVVQAIQFSAFLQPFCSKKCTQISVTLDKSWQGIEDGEKQRERERNFFFFRFSPEIVNHQGITDSDPAADWMLSSSQFVMQAPVVPAGYGGKLRQGKLGSHPIEMFPRLHFIAGGA